MASLHNAPDSQPGWDLLQTLKHDQSSSNLQRYRSTCAQVRMAKIHIWKHLRLRLIRIPKSPATNSPVAPMTKKSNVRIILGCLLEESHSRGLRGLRRMANWNHSQIWNLLYIIFSFATFLARCDNGSKHYSFGFSLAWKILLCWDPPILSLFCCWSSLIHTL